MKGLLILLGSGLVATTLAVAQDMPSSSNTDTSQSRQTQQTHQTSNGVIRGCLSGSAGNYTITDQNGMQYTINGPDNQLQSSVGHEVEVTTSQDQASQTSTQGDQTTSSATNSVQVSNLHDLGGSCKPSSSMGNGPVNNENKGASPQQVPDAAAQPQTMAMLQEQQGMGQSSPQQTTPPVTSQTPATPGASTNSAQQAAPPSSNSATTGTATTPNTTGSQAAPSAQPDGMNANPSTGRRTARARTLRRQLPVQLRRMRHSRMPTIRTSRSTSVRRPTFRGRTTQAATAEVQPRLRNTSSSNVMAKRSAQAGLFC